MTMTLFPTMDGFGPTRETLHYYAQALNALARVHAEPRPHWWHTSLKLTAEGLESDLFPMPDGRIARLQMNLNEHRIELRVNDAVVKTFPMTADWSGTAMGTALINAVAKLGLQGDYERQRFESSAPGAYDPAAAARFFIALTSANQVFVAHLATLPGPTGPVQLWPHNFDLSAEWYGTRMIVSEIDGAATTDPAQLNLGFYPGGSNAEAYFYSNPWPFEAEALLTKTLPHGAEWHTDGWKGTILPYGVLMDEPDAQMRLAEYARAVFALVFPTLMA